MKTRSWRTAVAAFLTSTLLCSLAAELDDSKAAGGITNANPPIIVPPAPDPVATAPTNTPSPAAPTSTNVAPLDVSFQFPKLSLPPLLDQVVRLNQSGTDEAVVRAYIEKAAPAYQVTGNEIIQLQDLGVPRSVILALIEHSKTASSAPAGAPATDLQPTAAPASQTNEVAAGTAEAAADFREPLAPYGTWMDVPGYGYCWQPTVMVVNPDWRPYCDYGDWRWSDSGWYWNSYYSWGWAPFHYGRWFTYANRGWFWCPDRVWGPAWVSWRNSSSFCGWAPLPPGACFFAGRGWSFRGVSVGVDFSFGLGAAHFTFVPHSRFSERHVGSHAVRGMEASSHYRNTTVLNNYATGPNNRLINQGVGRHQIAAASQTPIREVSASELPRAGQRIAAPTGRNSLARAVQSSPDTRTGAGVAGRDLSSRAAQSTMFNQRTASRAMVAGGGAAQRLMPNYSQSPGNRMSSAQVNRSAPMAAARTAPSMRSQPQFQPRAYSPGYGGRAEAPGSFAPSRSAAPAQRFVSPGGAGRSMPSGGGQFRGAMSHGGGHVSGRSVGAHR